MADPFETYYATLSSPEINLDPPLKAMFDESVPTLSGGDGGVTETGRAGRKAFTEWGGQGVRKLDFGLVIDGTADIRPEGTRVGVASDRSVEFRISRFDRLAMSPNDFTRPPIVNVAGASFPAAALDIDWIVSNMTWGAAIVGDDGARVQQDVKIQMIEYVEADILLTKNVSGPKSTKITGKHRLSMVKKGDTLETIAVRTLRKAGRWKEIAKLNGLRGVKIPAKLVGKYLKVPLQ